MIQIHNQQRQAHRMAREYQKAFDRVLLSGQFLLGPEVEALEKALAEMCGAKFGVGVANGFEALQIALLSLEIPLCGEIITTPLASVATTQAILAAGHLPVFADVDAETGLLSPEEVASRISPLTVAILPVHLYGRPARMEELETLAQEKGLFLAQDAAQAHGARRLGRPLGNFGGEKGVMSTSFYQTQNLGALGDGGMVLLNDEKAASIARELRNFGFADDGTGRHARRGMSSRLDEIQAAGLMERLPFLDEENATRLQIARRYNAEIHHELIHVPNAGDRDESVYHHFPVRVRKDREGFRAFLESKGVETAVHYPELIPRQAAFSGMGTSDGEWPEAEAWAREEVSIPIHPDLTSEEVEEVVAAINGWKP
jgi:dTDP-4-amino-4,6-dideoxygalactose transaminase